MEQYLIDILEQTKDNLIVSDAFTKADSIINNPKYKDIVCSISGGADSDVMLDLIYKVDKDKKVRYVWFDTGIEYQATKDHLVYLENRYEIQIERIRPKKTIPICCKEYGQPFLSKEISENIGTLQNNNFQWKDEDYQALLQKYPNCKSAIKWWCNKKGVENISDTSDVKYNIAHKPYLKEFMIQNPPTFKISKKCCYYTKKKLSHDIKCDLMITGVRKAEDGVRAMAYKSCYSTYTDKRDSYRPLFWFGEPDKDYYVSRFGIKHSDCYEVWGFTRTGCVGCPYSLSVQGASSLDISGRYEPRLVNACRTIFKDSYEYTKQYFDFRYRMKQLDKKGIKSLF